MAPDPEDLTADEEKLLAMYIAKFNREHDGRDSPDLYKILVNSDGTRTWSRKHSWKTWRAYYIEHQERMDALIAARLKESTNTRIPPRGKGSARNTTKKGASAPRRVRVEFSRADDIHLLVYLAIENPLPKDRQGNVLYERLVANSKGLWPWSTRHTAQSWRERYVKDVETFDRDIRRFMKKRGFTPSDVSNEKQRRKMWEKLDENGDERPTPSLEPSKVDLSKKKSSRPANDIGKGREEDAAQQDKEPPASEKAKGKRRAADDNDERIRKKMRVAKAAEHVPEAEERAVSAEDKIVQRALSIPLIAAVEASDTEPSSAEDQLLSFETDGGNQVTEKPVILASHNIVQTSTHNAETSPGRCAIVDGVLPELGPQLAQQDPPSPITFGDEHLGEINYALSGDMRMASQDPYPATSTPRHEAVLPASQAIPTPRTLAALAAKKSENASPDTLPVQEPTPPTSDAPFSPNLHHVEQESSPPSHDVDELHSQPGSPTARHPSTSPVSTPSPPQRHLGKRKPLKRHSKDDEFFETPPNASPPGSTSTPERRRARQLPVRVEGALNSTLTDAKGLPTAIHKGARRKSDIAQDVGEDEEPVEWPPKRRKTTSAVRQKTPLSRKDASPAPPHSNVQAEASDDVLPPSSPAQGDHHPFSQPSPDVPSRIHHPFSQPTQLPYEPVTLAGPSNAIIERETPSDHPSSIESRGSPVLKYTSKASKSRSNGRLGDLIRQPVPFGFGLGLRPSVFATAPTLLTDPSTSTPWGSRVDKGKQRAVVDYDTVLSSNRRHTLGGLFPFSERDAQVRRPRPSLSSSSPTSSSSSGPVLLAPGDVVLAPQDHEEVYKLMLKQAARKTGFSKDVVRQVWHATGSWTAACEILNGERVQERTGHAIVEGIEEHSRVEASRSCGNLEFRSLGLLDGRAQTPPARAAPAAPPESPAYVPPDNSRAAIYLKTHGLFDTAKKQRLSEEQHTEDDADAEEEDPDIPILLQVDDLETRRRQGQGVSNDTKIRIEHARRMLAALK